MTRSIRMLLALGAFFVLAVAVAACGGVPGNGVAKVGGTVITKDTFNHWLGVAARSSQPPGTTAAVAVPDAPKFTKCVAQKQLQQQQQRQQQKSSKAPVQTDAQLKALCQQEYAGLRDQVMQFLISSQWINGEAGDQGLSVSDKDVQKEFQKQKLRSFPKDADFQKFLKSSGMTLKDILFRVKLDLLSNKIRTKVTKSKSSVSDAQIAAYYNQNKQRFGQPARAELLVVLTKDQAKANQAKSAIAGGQSFAAVAKKFSIDTASKAQGGKLTVSKGQQEQALDNAVFSAKAGQLTGPVKTQFGFYVFKVTKVTPAAQQTLAQSKATIRQILTTQGGQSTLQAFVKKFQTKWKSRTDCRKEFIIQSCKNAPKPKPVPSTGVPPGAVPQGGGAQQVPQGAQQVPQSGGAQQVPQGAQQVPQSGGAAQTPSGR